MRKNDAIVKSKELTPGECIAVDMMTSPTPGIISKLTRNLTKNGYKYVTVYVDPMTKYGFIVMQKLPR